MSDVWKGIALPWSSDLDSFTEPKNDVDILKSSIIWLVLTRLGERVMLPTFGTRIWEVPFDPADDMLADRVKTMIREAVRTWDDRIKIEQIKLEFDYDHHRMNIVVIFRNAKDPIDTSNREVNFAIGAASPLMLE